jgi:UDP-N-acetylglucosamine pyrophosphorylase
MIHSHNTCAVILAAGKGTRMRSESPKVLAKLEGKPLVHFVIGNIQKAGIQNIVVVVGYKKEEVIDACSGFSHIQFVEQKEQLGTGHALLCVENALSHFSGSILVACGDVPLIQPATFQNLLVSNQTNQEYATVLSAILEDAGGYGRIVRNRAGSIARIVEHKDASVSELSIQEVNTGTYVFQSPPLFEKLKAIGSQNAQNEYYLPDLFKIYDTENKKCGVVMLKNSLESLGINSPDDLEYVSSVLSQGRV